jgi:hypothetical protein
MEILLLQFSYYTDTLSSYTPSTMSQGPALGYSSWDSLNASVMSLDRSDLPVPSLKTW